MRESIQNNIQNEALNIFTEDLKTLLYTTQTDEDFELFLNAVKK